MKKDKNMLTSIYKKTTIEKIKRKIKLLGISSKVNLNEFLTTRLIICALLIVVPIFSPFGIIYGPVASVLFWYIYEILILDIPIKQRNERLDKQAPFFFEVLVMTLESGRNLEKALNVTSLNVSSELAYEFRKSLNELNLGKTLNEVLESLKERIPSVTVNNIILNLMQANTFGTSMIDSLNTQLEYLKEKRILETKAKINKLPMKISTISVLFLIPITILLLITPVIINSIENNKKIDITLNK